MFTRENEFDDLVLSNANKYGVPAWVIKATIGRESSFNPKAYRAEPDLTPPDASRGLMQLLGSTAQALGLHGDVGDDVLKVGGLYEPALNIQLGAKLLGQLHSRFSGEPWDNVYAAYNAGTIRRDPNGVLLNETNVEGWRKVGDYFNPTWRTMDDSNPFRQAPGRTNPGR